MINLNRKVFYAKVRHGPFPGRLTPNQVSGMDDLFDEWLKSGTSDPRHLAYTLATDFHETGARMQPVREGFKNSRKEAAAYVKRNYGHKGSKWYCFPAGPWGHVYFGGGDVQLTWYDNYVRMGEILNLPLAEFPDMVMDPKVSKMILVEGMTNGVSHDGDFTGLSVEDFFNDAVDDPNGARRIVNGKDKAFLIAGYHDEFLEALEAAIATYQTSDDETRTVAPVKLPKADDPISWGGVVAVVGGGAGAVLGYTESLSGVWAAVIAGALLLGAGLLASGRKKILDETGE